MNKLTNLRKFVFASIITLFSVISNAQTLSPLYPSGENPGSVDNPYLIKSADDWNNIFANEANYATYWASGVYVQLDANITVSNMVGSSDHYYKGNFEGNWDTLNFEKGTINNAFGEEKCAPFRYIDGATIQNLTVTGKIVSSKRHMGGFVAWANSSTAAPSYITNCTSSIEIDCSQIYNSDGNPSDMKHWDCSAGGFIGQIEKGDVNFVNCIFDGKIYRGEGGDDYQANANRGAGFVSYVQTNKAKYTNCTMAGMVDLYSTNHSDWIATFNRNNNNTFNGVCYYTDDYGYVSDSHCEAALAAPNDLSRKYKVVDEPPTYKYVPGAVFTGLETTTFYYGGTPIVLTPTVSYYGRTLTRGTDYVIKIDGTVLESGNPTFSAGGDYVLSIEGKTGSNYAGAHTVMITVIEINSWTVLKTLLSSSSGTFTLTQDITADVESAADTNFVVTSNITLNLGGFTIDRGLVHVNEDNEVVADYAPDYNGPGRVIKIKNGASLTINGPGTITGGYHKAVDGTDNPKNDGGGIWNMGNLVMNEVTVSGNKVEKLDPASTTATGRGGGIFSGSGSSLEMNDYCVISCNEAHGGGGGVYVQNASKCNITDATIYYNVSQDKGGGLRLAPPGNKTYNIVRCNIIGNSVTDKSESKGGGIYVQGQSNSTLNLNSCYISFNTAFIDGGALYSQSGNTIATNCTMEMDMSYDQLSAAGDGRSYGGAVYIYGGEYTMDGGSITGCRTETNGGAVYVASGKTFNVQGKIEIKDCYYPTDENPNTDNNVYLAGDNVIHVTGPLDPSSEIHVTKAGGGSIMDGNSEYWSLSNFSFDDDSYRVKIGDDGKVELYRPYSWTDDPTNWDGYIVKDGENYTIKAAITIPNGCVATPTSITFESDPNTTGGEIIIEDGGQLVYGTSIPVTVKKNISKATADDNGWYTISSAVHDHNQTYVSISNIKIIIENIFNDMFSYDEATSMWLNRKTVDGGTGFTTMESGRGYLYRNGEDVGISYLGETNVDDIYYTLSCAADNELKGFNLVGNPYTKNITLMNTTLVDNANEQIVDGGDNPVNLTGFYRLNNSGSWGVEIISMSEPIKVNEGFLIQIPEEAKKIKFSQTPRVAKKGNANNIMFTVENSEYSDVAYAWLGAGLDLTKISHRNPEIPMVYIHNDNKDYAIATMSDDVKAFNLNFEAKTFGRYTLSVKPQGEFEYLHLYDKLTDEDIDLLKESEYEFVGSTADGADRFVVRLDPSTPSTGSGTEVFVWQSGNDIIVEGNGELQVFDVMGRLVSTQYVNGVETMCTSSLQTGVYVFRLEGKAQKIVIR